MQKAVNSAETVYADWYGSIKLRNVFKCLKNETEGKRKILEVSKLMDREEKVFQKTSPLYLAVFNSKGCSTESRHCDRTFFLPLRNPDHSTYMYVLIVPYREPMTGNRMKKVV